MQMTDLIEYIYFQITGLSSFRNVTAILRRSQMFICTVSVTSSK
jgi:hypothetical protein